MHKSKDAYGQQLLKQYYGKNEETSEIIERDDGFIGSGSDAGRYFTDYPKWTTTEKRAIKLAKGKVLDVGCGAGRHSLYLQKQGLDVVGIDNSPGAIKVCKLRGLKNAKVLPVEQIDKLPVGSFNTVMMMGNNFGLMANPKKAKQILKKLYKITKPDAQIIAENRNPYKTKNPIHLSYHKLNKNRGRMAGQIKMRVRFEKTIGDWFDYLFVSPQEMKDILENTGWKLNKIFNDGAEYIAVIKKSP